jgi:hypothetical protein
MIQRLLDMPVLYNMDTQAMKDTWAADTRGVK